jgi:hypothetical protein
MTVKDLMGHCRKMPLPVVRIGLSNVPADLPRATTSMGDRMSNVRGFGKPDSRPSGGVVGAMILKVRLLLDGAILPTLAHPGDAGLDLFAAESARVEPGEAQLVRP